MIEIPKEESLPNQENLTQALLEGKIDANFFIDQFFDLDQSTPDRKNAIKNVEVIERPEVKRILAEGTDADNFNNFYSFTHFHVFQINAHFDDMTSALEHLKISSEYASKIENDRHWPEYTRATVLYFENKLTELVDLYEQLGDMNKEVVARLIKGLEKRGYPDYNEDY